MTIDPLGRRGISDLLIVFFGGVLFLFVDESKSTIGEKKKKGSATWITRFASRCNDILVGTGVVGL